MNLVYNNYYSEGRKKCPKCNKGVLDERTPRGTLVKTFLFWLPIKRYRCSNCYKKSYVWGSVYRNNKPSTEG